MDFPFPLLLIPLFSLEPAALTRNPHSTWQQKGKAFEVVSRKEQGASWDSGVCFLGMATGSEVTGGRREPLSAPGVWAGGHPAGGGSRGTPEPSGTG